MKVRKRFACLHLSHTHNPPPPPFVRHVVFDGIIFDVPHVSLKIPFIPDDVVVERSLPLEFGKWNHEFMRVFLIKLVFEIKEFWSISINLLKARKRFLAFKHGVHDSVYIPRYIQFQILHNFGDIPFIIRGQEHMEMVIS